MPAVSQWQRLCQLPAWKCGQCRQAVCCHDQAPQFLRCPLFPGQYEITPRFTLNWGLRWDLAFPFSNDNSSNQLTFFNPNVANPSAINPANGQRARRNGDTRHGCTGCIGWNQMDMQWKHFSPRLGFSYQLNNKPYFWLDCPSVFWIRAHTNTA